MHTFDRRQLVFSAAVSLLFAIANSVSAANGEIVPEPEFSSSPDAGSALSFATFVISSSSDPIEITVDNSGTAELTLACEIIGPDSSQFGLLSCPSSIQADNSDVISVDCQPDSAGPKQATLEVSSNDADEPTPSYPLTCTGVNSPSGQFIHSTGFEDSIFSDLIVSGTGVNPNNLNRGQAFTVDATISNQGAADSAASNLHFYLSTDRVIGVEDLLLGSQAIAATPANSDANFNLETTAPDTSGTWWIGACVDSVKGESSTINQCSNGLALVVVPDATFIVNKATIPAGDDTLFEFTGDVDGPNLAGGGSSTVSAHQGTFSATETSTGGWTLLNISCEGVAADAMTITDTQATLDLGPGDIGTCTFTNIKLGSVTIRKATVGGVGAFSFAAVDMDNPAGPVTTDFILSTDIGDDNPDFITFTDLLPGKYLFTETVPANWTIDGSQGDIVCSGQNSSFMTLEQKRLDLVLLDGENLDCTFTNTSTIDSDNDRLTDVEETNLGTDPFSADTDGDGINDGDEVLGTLAGLDLPGMGTNPLRKDLLLEYDWFDDSIDCGAHSHRPSEGAIAKVTTAFSEAPTSNPGVLPGVNLINDYGQGGLFTGGNLIDDADGVIAGGVNNSDFKNYKTANFDSIRQGYFHYVLLPHRYNTTSGSSGQAEINGNDSIVSLYCARSDRNVANTIMHELGHNLGLRHGGDENCNRKPNYNSVMNYSYQFPGIDNDCTPPGNGVLSYSIGDRIDLDETNLNENHGTCGADAGVSWDWDEDGTIEDSVSYNINYDDSEIGNCGASFTTLHDYNDWDNMNFGGLSDSDGARLAPMEIISDQPVPAEFREDRD